VVKRRKFMKQGKYVVFEGIDGSGKTTQSEKFVEALTGLDIRTVWTREPGSDLISLKVRDILIDVKDGLDKRARELLFQADRAQHTKAIKKLTTNKEPYWVVSDRSFISGLAYGCACGNSPDVLWELSRYAANILPDYIVFVDTPPKVAAERRAKRDVAETYEEAKGLEHMETVYSNLIYFLEQLNNDETMMRNFPKIPVIRVDGTKPKEVIFDELKEHATRIGKHWIGV